MWKFLLIILGLGSLALSQSVKAQPAPGIVLLADGPMQERLGCSYQNIFHDVVQLNFPTDSARLHWLPLRVVTSTPLWLRWSDPRGAQTMLYARPGDTIRVVLHPGQIPALTFQSTRGIRTEFDFDNYLRRRHLSLGFPDQAGAQQVARLAAQANRYCAAFDERTALLSQLHDSVGLPADFRQAAALQIRAQYLQALVSPYWRPNASSLPTAYLLLIEDANVPALLRHTELLYSSATFRSLALSYVRFLSRDSLNTPHELATLLQRAAALPAPVRDFTRFYALKMQSGQAAPAALAPLYIMFRRDCTVPAYTHYLDSLWRRTTALTENAEVLATRLHTPAGESITWAQLLTQNRGRVVYLDLWASWCGPCLAEMPASAALQQQITGQAVQLVYLSVDASADKWQQARTNHQLDRPGVQHYRLAAESALARLLNAPPIPRYVLLDKQAQAVSLDAPRPGHAALMPLMRQLW